jgi:hypothetical protein
MSELDEAMLEHMAYLVIHESMPFCYRDFLRWDDGQKEWGMQHNTFRNKISKLRKAGKAKFCYYTSCAFYTIEGHPFEKPVTLYPYGGLPFSLQNLNKNDPLYKTIATLPFGAESIHDIRLRFTAQGIYNLFEKFNFPPNNFHCNSNSGDIVIPSFLKDNAVVRITVHRTDVVSVVIGCTKQPIPLDINGWSRFSSLLTRAEDKLQFILDNYYFNQTTCFPAASSLLTPSAVKKVVIPDYLSWLIVMWHFGRDALTEYNGEKFSRTIEDAQHILTRIYSKEWGNGRGRRTKMRIRAENQQYPNITVSEAIKAIEEASLDV